MNKKTEKMIIKHIGQKRFEHSLRVRDTAIKLASINGVDIEKVEKAALLHDCGKIKDDALLLKRAEELNIQLDQYMKESHELIHAPLGAKMAEEFYGIKDKDILNAIRYHTTGKEDMNMIEKVIYMADYIEPRRNFDGVEAIREMSFKDIDKALFMALDRTIIFLIEKRKLIQPKTIIARNKLIFI
jgi:predicted HD superfamily hydrolase involved in NAD metabolism